MYALWLSVTHLQLNAHKLMFVVAPKNFGYTENGSKYIPSSMNPATPEQANAKTGRDVPWLQQKNKMEIFPLSQDYIWHGSCYYTTLNSNLYFAEFFPHLAGHPSSCYKWFQMKSLLLP